MQSVVSIPPKEAMDSSSSSTTSNSMNPPPPTTPTPLEEDVTAWRPGDPYTVSLFYRYVEIADPDSFVLHLKSVCNELGLLGRILVASEGINGTLAGSASSLERFRNGVILSDERFRLIDWKTSNGPSIGSDFLPFLSLSVRREKEIISAGSTGNKVITKVVAFNDECFGGLSGTGTHLTPEEFHEGIAIEGAVVIDVRNEFEYDIGRFKNAVCLKTFQYSESWAAIDKIIDEHGLLLGGNTSTISNSNTSFRSENVAASSITTSVNDDSCEKADATSLQRKPPPVYMYCTGGIRCEKASAYMRGRGVQEVYQLQGGIHRYLEAYDDRGDGRFVGKNFVFDSRVAVPAASSSANTAIGGSSASNSNNSNSNSNNNSNSGSSSIICGGIGDVCNTTVQAAASPETVVGTCIDCGAGHDIFSGRITCTVCRMPVLCCPICVTNNPHPDEYYCTRHRNLKNIYFTVLSRYSVEDLIEQRRLMENMLPQLASKKDKHRRQTLQKQIARINECIACKSSSIASLELSESKSSPGVESLDSSIEHASNVLDNLSNPKTRTGWGFWRS